MPDRGRNPIPALATFAATVATLEAEWQRRMGLHPHLGRPFLTPTVLTAGTEEQINVIPAQGCMVLDIRTVPGIDHSQLVAQLEEGAVRAGEEGGVTLKLTVLDDRPSTRTAPDAPVVRAVMAAHRKVTGRPAFLGGVPGATDGTILWRDARIPVVVYGPGSKWIAHQADEYVEVSELNQAAEVYAEAARRYLSGDMGA
jgi:succinyl-diaminopimelate desuccinylase